MGTFIAFLFIGLLLPSLLLLFFFNEILWRFSTYKGRQHLQQGSLEQAEDWIEEAFKHASKLQNDESILAESFYQVAQLRQAQRHQDDASLFYLRALKLKQQLLGSRHLQVIRCRLSLAHSYLQQRLLEEAYKELQTASKSLEIPYPEQVLKTPPDQHVSKGKLLSNNVKQTWLLTLWQELQAPQQAHQHIILEIYNGFACYYYSKEKYLFAERLAQRVFRQAQKELTSEHPLYSHFLFTLAQSRLLNTKSPTVLEEINEAISSFEKSHHATDPMLSDILQLQADYYQQKGHYNKAKEALERALLIQEKYFGHDDPILLRTLQQQADLAYQNSDIWTAKTILEQIEHWFNIFDDVLSYDKLQYHLLNAQLSITLGKYEDCKSQIQAFKQYTSNKENHMLCSKYLIVRGQLEQCLGQYERSESYFRKAFHRAKQVVDSEHPLCAQILQMQADLYLSKQHHLGVLQSQEPKPAEPHSQIDFLLQRAKKLWEKHFGSSTPHNAFFLHTQAKLAMLQKQFQPAQKALTLAKQYWTRSLSSKHHLYIPILQTQIELYIEQNDLPQAQSSLEELQTLLKPSNEVLPPLYAKSLELQLRYHLGQKEYTQATEKTQEILAIWDGLHTPTHPDSLKAMELYLEAFPKQQAPYFFEKLSYRRYHIKQHWMKQK